MLMRLPRRALCIVVSVAVETTVGFTRKIADIHGLFPLGSAFDVMISKDSSIQLKGGQSGWIEA
jgi:hypothetical protein